MSRYSSYDKPGIFTLGEFVRLVVFLAVAVGAGVAMLKVQQPKSVSAECASTGKGKFACTVEEN